MEKRAILAAVLMAAVFIVYQTFFFPEPPPQKPPAQSATQAPVAPTPAPAAPPTSPAPAPWASQAPRPLQRLATVESPLYRAVVSSEGGKLQELVLRYRGEKPMVIVGDLGPAGLQLAPGGNSPGEVVPMALSTERIAVGPERPTQDLVLTSDVDGLHVRQTLTVRADDFAIDVSLRVENDAGAPRTVTIALPWLTRQAWHATQEKFQGQHPTEIVWSSNGQIKRIEDLMAVVEQVADGEWIAVGSVWYLAALVA